MMLNYFRKSKEEEEQEEKEEEAIRLPIKHVLFNSLLRTVTIKLKTTNLRSHFMLHVLAEHTAIPSSWASASKYAGLDYGDTVALDKTPGMLVCI